MDEALTCCAGGLGLILAVVVARVRGINQMKFFLPLGCKVVEKFFKK